MYEEFFGLTDRPFNAAPLAKRFLAIGSIEAARGSLARGIERAEGIGLLVGPAGSGKTLLCQTLAEQFRGRLAVANLSSGRLSTRRHFLQAILHELGLQYRGLDDGEMALALSDFAANSAPHAQGILLILDEAHTLPARLLEEARLLTNITRGGESRVRLVVSGAAALEERLATPKLESFNQRIATRCYLQALSYDDTLNYVRGAISLAGGDWQRVFTHEALVAVHRATDGIPRLINQVCDHAMMLGLAGAVKPLDKSAIDEAWSDLQQLPTPWNIEQGAPENSPDIIEFGSLDDEPIAARIGDDAAPSREPSAISAIGFEDELELFHGEPSERLAHIERQLSALDQPPTVVRPSRRPASSRPMRASADGAFDPDAEDFDEEEIVIDRFAGAVVEPMSDRPKVRTDEGRQLASYLSAAPAPKSAMTIALPVADDPVMPEETESYAASGPASGLDDLDLIEHVAHVETRRGTAAIQETRGVAAAAESDADLIIIEEDPPAQMPLKPNSGVRRQEYRQLFARLRRGS